jgi:hypothetical protein
MGTWFGNKTEKIFVMLWAVPLVDSDRCKLSLSRLKFVIKQASCSLYFWVDVLCIDQMSLEEMREEISKQAAIFARAKGVLVYLWLLIWNDLVIALHDIGDIVLWAFNSITTRTQHRFLPSIKHNGIRINPPLIGPLVQFAMDFTRNDS